MKERKRGRGGESCDSSGRSADRSSRETGSWSGKGKVTAAKRAEEPHSEKVDCEARGATEEARERGRVSAEAADF